MPWILFSRSPAGVVNGLGKATATIFMIIAAASTNSMNPSTKSSL